MDVSPVKPLHNKVVLLSVLLAVLPFVLLIILPQRVTGPLFGEDKAIEWLGAIAWALASFWFVLAAARLYKRHMTIKAFWLLILSVICFLATGEEISWGQRLFSIETPEIIANHNLQNELNLHNLKWLDVRLDEDGNEKTGLSRWLTFNRLGSVFWMGFLILLPLLHQYIKPLSRILCYLKVPVTSTTIAFCGIGIYAGFTLAVLASSDALSTSNFLRNNANELKESLVAVLFTASAFLFYRIRAGAEDGYSEQL